MLFSHSLGASPSLLFYLSIHTDLGISRPVSLILKLILRARHLAVWLTVPFALTSPPTKQHQAVAHRIETPSCIPNGHYVLYTSRLGTHNNKMVCSTLWPRCCIFIVFSVSHWTISEVVSTYSNALTFWKYFVSCDINEYNKVALVFCRAPRSSTAPNSWRKKCLPTCNFHLTMVECRSCSTLGCFLQEWLMVCLYHSIYLVLQKP